MPLEFYNIIKDHAEKSPDHPAIIDGDVTLTYGQLLEQVERFAGALDSLGLNANSKMGIFCLNQKEYLVALLGGLLKGVPIVPFNFMLTPEDMGFITKDAELDVLVFSNAFAKPETAPFFQIFKHRVLVGQVPDPSLVPEGTIPFEQFVQNGDRQAGFSRHQRGDGIPDVILYTSGTTARPKGVMLEESQFFANTTGVKAHLNFQPEDRAIMALPLFHSFGNIIALVFLRSGGTLILIPQFQPKTILGAISKYQATTLPLVPTIYSFLVDLYSRGGYDVSTLKYCVSGGAALPTALLKKVEEALGVTVFEGYGLTETSPVISVNTFAGGSVVGSVGPVLPNVEVKIVNEQGQTVDQGDIGEILVKAETVMKGYWKRPDETSEILSADGWLKTGDLGHVDEQGRLYISAGRKKDLIIRAGENVSPLAIENALMNHPAIAEVAAIGVPHDRVGEQVKVCATLREGAVATEKDLKDYCRKNLPAFMVPDSFQFYEGLPKNATGKILKKQLREEAQK